MCLLHCPSPHQPIGSTRQGPGVLLAEYDNPPPLPGGHGTPGWLQGGRKQTPSCPVTSPCSSPGAAAACLRALRTWSLPTAGSSAKRLSLAPDSGRAAGGACTVPTINSSYGVKLSSNPSSASCQLCDLRQYHFNSVPAASFHVKQGW